MLTLSRRRAALLMTATLAGCGGGGKPSAARGSLEWAIAGPWRLNPERDPWRHPFETLRFWGIAPQLTVLELLPGRGWYTTILAPYLKQGGGHLIVAGFDRARGTPAQRETQTDFERRFLTHPDQFGHIEETVLSPSGALAPDASVDLAILDNNVHTLMAEGAAERVFGQIAAALKQGGVFGVEQHRASSTGLQDPLAGSGYVQEAYVKTLAQEAGLDFVAASDINANPRDTRVHPFGVWTLPPTLRTSPLGQPDNPHFDTRPYVRIGESDRMTLKFRKSGAAHRG